MLRKKKEENTGELQRRENKGRKGVRRRGRWRKALRRGAGVPSPVRRTGVLSGGLGPRVLGTWGHGDGPAGKESPALKIRKNKSMQSIQEEDCIFLHSPLKII